MIIKIDEHLILEDVKISFAEELLQLVNKNRDRLKQFLGWVDDMKSVKDEKKYIKTINKDFTTNFVVKFDEKIVGTVDFHDFKIENNRKTADIGYWLDADFENKGIITKSCKKLIDYGVENLGLNTIYIHCAVDNEKSENVAKRLGFKFVKIVKNYFHLYGNYFNTKEYIH